MKGRRKQGGRLRVKPPYMPAEEYDRRRKLLDSGLQLPPELVQEVNDETRRREAEKAVERRKGAPLADKLVRRDGTIRKGRHTAGDHRARANRKHGRLKGITGA